MSVYKPKMGNNAPVDLTRCREGVHSRDGWRYSQCGRRGKDEHAPKNGEPMLYCKQHHPDTVKARNKAAYDKRQLKQERAEARTVRLGLAMATVEQLRAALARKEMITLKEQTISDDTCLLLWPSEVLYCSLEEKTCKVTIRWTRLKEDTVPTEETTTATLQPGVVTRLKLPDTLDCQYIALKMPDNTCLLYCPGLLTPL